MINKTPKKKNKLDFQNLKTELNIRNYAIKTFRAIILFPAFPAPLDTLPCELKKK